MTSCSNFSWARNLREGHNLGNWEFKILIPAEGVLLSKAIVEVTNQEGSLVVVEELLKVMHD